MPSYYSNSGPARLSMFPSVIKWLLGINVAVFVIGMIPIDYMGMSIPLDRYFEYYAALWPLASPNFKVWQYVSYMFLHGSITHIFFNLLTLWMFGMELAHMWGAKRFLVYYLLCGLGAGIIHSIVTMILGNGAPTVGASGAIMGVMIAFGLTFPDRIVFMGLFFPMRAKFAVLVFAGIDLYMGISGSTDGVAHFAHLGGALVGFILLKIGGNLTLGGIFDKIPGFGRKQPLGFMQGTAPAPTVSRRDVVEVRHRDMEQPRQRPVQPTFDLGDDRLNEVLDKMLRTKQRYQDLNDEERAILDNASQKIRRGPANGVG